MASTNRIDSIYDVAAITTEQKRVEELVRASIEQIKQARTQSIDFSVNTKTIADYNKKIKDLEKTLAGVQKASDAATKSSILASKAAEAEAKARTANAKAAREEEKTIVNTGKAKQLEDAITKKLEKEQEKLNKQREREAKLLDQAENDYLQLSKAYNDAALKAKNFALVLGEMHPVTVTAIADAKAMGDTLKRLDAVTGDYRRNVGNYTQATFALNQVIREAPAFANSFATGISAISNNVPMLVDQFKILRTEVGSGFKALKILGGSLLSFQALLPIGFLLLQSFGKELVSFFSNIGKSADETKRLEQNLSALVAEGDKAIKTLEALAKQAEFLIKLGDVTIDLNFTDDFERSILRARTRMVSLIEEAGTLGSEIEKSTTRSAKAFDLFQTNAGKSAREAVNIFSGSLRELPQEITDTFSETDKKLAAAAVATSQNLFDLQNRLLDNEQKRTLLAADIRLLRVEEQRKKEKEAADEKEKEDKEALRRREAIRKATFEILKANIELDKEFDLLRSADEKRTFEDRINNLAIFGEDSKRLIEETAEFEKGSADLTAKERLKIENDKNNALIRLGQDLNEKLKKLAVEQAKAFEVGAERPGATSKLPAAIQKVLDDFDATQKKAIKDAEDNAKKLAEALRSAFVSLATELEGLFFDIFTNAIEVQKNVVQDQIDLLEKQKQKDIEVANQTITNASDRADAIAVIEARAAAKKQQLELKQRQLDQQKARFEKARAVVDIIQNTSLAVVKALGQFPGPAGIALAAVIGALGAVQLARVLAQPIPRYKDGTENHPGGLAVVGDGGKSETVVLPDGSLYRTPSKDTLVNLPAGTKVIPDYQGKPQSVGVIQPVDTTDEIRAMRFDVVRAIKKIPQPIIHAERAWTQAHKTGSSYRNYLNRSI